MEFLAENQGIADFLAFKFELAVRACTQLSIVLWLGMSTRRTVLH